MAQVVYQEASPTITTTEYSLANASTTLAIKTDKGVYAVIFDFSALVGGDQYIVQLYETARSSAGTKRVVESWFIEGALSKPNCIMPSTGGYLLGNGWDWTIKKNAGVDEAIPYTLWRIQG